jgi:hypothetical protein
MQFKLLNKTDKYQWTQHALMKLKFYGLSQQRITRVIKSPQRIEEGIVENTIAVMQPVSLRKISASRGKPALFKKDTIGLESRNLSKNSKGKAWTSEIWAMYQIKSDGKKAEAGKNLLNNQKQFKIISVWRYPGVSPARDPIPQEILEEIKSLK